MNTKIFSSLKQLKAHCDDILEENNRAIQQSEYNEAHRQYDHADGYDARSYWLDVRERIRCGERLDKAMRTESDKRIEICRTNAVGGVWAYWRSVE